MRTWSHDLPQPQPKGKKKGKGKGKEREPPKKPQNKEDTPSPVSER